MLCSLSISSGSAGYVGSNVLLFLGPDPGISEAVGALGTTLNGGSSPALCPHTAEPRTRSSFWSCWSVWESLSQNLAVLFPSQRSFTLAWYQFSSCLTAPLSSPAPSPHCGPLCTRSQAQLSISRVCRAECTFTGNKTVRYFQKCRHTQRL